MSETDSTATSSPADDESIDASTAAVSSGDDSVADVERSLLRTENERLRRELERTTRTTYRRTALALLAVGLASAGLGLVLPAGRTVLVVVGAIGIFGGVLTWYLTPDTVLSASVPESVVDAHSRTVSDLQTELGLREDVLYVPAPGQVAETRVFLPLHAAYEVPDALTDLFVTAVDDADERTRGVALQPTGAHLYRALDGSLDGDLTPDRLPDAVPEALVEQFELAASARGDRTDETFTVELDAPAIDGLDRPDHPVVSFVGVATARALDRPVTVETVDAEDGRIVLAW